MDPRDFLDELFEEGASIATQARACFDFFEFHTGWGRWEGVHIDDMRIVAFHVLVATVEGSRRAASGALYRALQRVAAYNMSVARAPLLADQVIAVFLWRPPADPTGPDRLCLAFADQPEAPFVLRTDEDIQVGRMPFQTLVEQLGRQEHAALQQLLVRGGIEGVPELLNRLALACQRADASLLEQRLVAVISQIASAPGHADAVRDLVLSAPDAAFRRLGLLLS